MYRLQMTNNIQELSPCDFVSVCRRKSLFSMLICIWNEWISGVDMETFYVNGDFSIMWPISIETVKTAKYEISDLKRSVHWFRQK